MSRFLLNIASIIWLTQMECVVESTPSAETFYERFGFRRQECVRVEPPDEFADKRGRNFDWIWMVRKPGKYSA